MFQRIVFYSKRPFAIIYSPWWRNWRLEHLKEWLSLNQTAVKRGPTSDTSRQSSRGRQHQRTKGRQRRPSLQTFVVSTWCREREAAGHIEGYHHINTITIIIKATIITATLIIIITTMIPLLLGAIVLIGMKYEL